MRRWLLCGGVAIVLTLAPPKVQAGDKAASISPEDPEFFEKKIRPLLVENCFKCHSGAKAKGKLWLDSRTGLLRGGESGLAVTPGDVKKGLLLKGVAYDDPEFKMPPGGKLQPQQIADLREWVERGVPWPDDGGGKTIVKKDFDLQERAKHWSLRPLTNPPVPKVKNQAWVQSPIDSFLLAGMESRGITPALPADRRTLLRRVTFDLIGLPPTLEEIDDFLKDQSAEAYIRVVDRLLASPHYGERWARHWLDLVRYAETQGHEFDFEIPDAYQYRDYVIRAFNADVPYDLFVKEHLAGDLLDAPRRHPKDKTNESVLATGFWWLGEAKHSPVDSRADQADRIDNQIDVFSKTFLGLTVACARCHDHKFDAISTRDYYALAGVLQSSRQDRPIVEDPGERGVKLDGLVKARSPIRDLVSPMPMPARVGVQGRDVIFAQFTQGNWGGWRVGGEAFGSGPSGPQEVMILDGKAKDGVQAVTPGLAHSGLLSVHLQGSLRSPTFVIDHKRIHYHLAGKHARVRLVVNGLQLIQDPIYGRLAFTVNQEKLGWHTQDVTMWMGQRAYIEILDEGPGYAALDLVVFSDEGHPLTSPYPIGKLADGAGEKLPPLVDHFRQAESKLGNPQRSLAMTDGNAIDEFVFIRGNHKKPGESVGRRFLEVFQGRPLPASGSGRLELANHVTDPARTPITPRVLVNRLWKHHFGEGLVRSVDDFGVLGQSPTHPELLDYLAGQLVNQGWSIKKLHRFMLLSSAYQMASKATRDADEADPENKLLHKMPVRRLEAEAIRDSLLAVSGRLERKMHGPGVMPHLTSFMVGRGRPGVNGPLDGGGRRSIYLAVRRNFLNPMFLAFDYPTPFSTMGRRSVSNVPAQALTMMNNPLVRQQAELWAKRLLAEKDLDSRQRISRMVETALGRPPLQGELVQALTFLEDQARLHGRVDDPQAWADLAQVLFNLKEFVFVN